MVTVDLSPATWRTMDGVTFHPVEALKELQAVLAELKSR
jgi:hypothetical protein